MKSFDIAYGEWRPPYRKGMQTILKKVQTEIQTLGHSRYCPEAGIVQEEQFGRWWTTATSKHVRKEEHKIKSMKERYEECRE